MRLSLTFLIAIGCHDARLINLKTFPPGFPCGAAKKSIAEDRCHRFAYLTLRRPIWKRYLQCVASTDSSIVKAQICVPWTCRVSEIYVSNPSAHRLCLIKGRDLRVDPEPTIGAHADEQPDRFQAQHCPEYPEQHDQSYTTQPSLVRMEPGKIILRLPNQHKRRAEGR